MKVCNPLPHLRRPQSIFLFFHHQDEASPLPGIFFLLVTHFSPLAMFLGPLHLANNPLDEIHFPFFYLKDEASTMPGIYLKCTKHIFDKFKNLFEKVRFSAEIRRSTFVTLCHARHLFEMSKT